MANWYNSGIYGILNEDLALTTANDLRVLLCDSSYTFNDAHDYVSGGDTGTGITDNELSGGGYARVALTGEYVDVDNTGDGAKFDADNTTFPSLGAIAGTPTHAIIYKYNAADTAAQLICRVPLPGTAPDGNNYVIQWHADGIGYWRKTGGANPFWYNEGVERIMEGDVLLKTHTLKMALVTSSYTFNNDHTTPTNFSAAEITNTNYARQDLASVAPTLDDTGNGAYISFTNVTFASLAAGDQPAYAIVYDDTDAADTLLFMLELTTPDTPDGNNYTIEIAAGGAATVYNS